MNRILSHIDAFIAAHLGESLPELDAARIDTQRQAFLVNFGPDVLRELSGSELLRLLPSNLANDQPMDYWLEFRNDETFDFSLFGRITGGSAMKYGTWQDKSTGRWRAAPHKPSLIEDISEDEARRIVTGRRDECLAAVDALKPFQGREPAQLSPRAFHHALAQAAPTWHNSVWLHKYLHMVAPELVTLNASRAWSEAALYNFGVTPNGEGIYAQDLQLIQLVSGLSSLAHLPTSLKYLVIPNSGPRTHWVIGACEQLAPLTLMDDEGVLALGPASLGSLSNAISLSRTKTELRQAISATFLDLEIPADTTTIKNLTELCQGLKEGDLVTLATHTSQIALVGRVVGDYQFRAESEYPHQLPIRWETRTPSSLSAPLEHRDRLTKLAATHPLTAQSEGVLILEGAALWQRGSVEAPDAVAEEISDKIMKNKQNDVIVPASLPALTGLTRQVVGMLERKRQVILYGPPGTGKTYHAERVALELIARHNYATIPRLLSERQHDAIHGRAGQPPYLATCTFHPMYSYEDFIEGYRPDGAGFSLEDGIFKRMVRAALAEPNKRFVLIIDEINRGNIPKIFGELITLIEASKRGVTRAILPLSRQPFTVPENLLVIATMNTADRSILLLDTALRRRFAFKELLPEPQLLREGNINDVPLSTWLRALNRRIVAQLGRDGRNLQVGHAYLMPHGKPVATLARIAEIVRDDLWPLLQEYCYEDLEKLCQILAADQGGIFDRQRGELRWELFESGREDALARALLAIITPEDIEQEASLPDTESAQEHDLDEDA